MGRDGTGVKAASATSIQITFTYNGRQCRERIKLKPTAANLKRAEAHRILILEAIENGTFDYAVTFPNSSVHKQQAAPEALKTGRYLEQWLDEKRPTIKRSTYNGYYKVIRQLNVHLGHIPIGELSRKHIADYARTLTCGNKTINNKLSPLRKALEDAVQHLIIDDNPIKNWGYKRIMPPKAKAIIDPFTKDEQRAILAELTGQAHNLIKFAFWTGLRTSELIAIEWGDIDWHRQTIRIERAKTQDSRDDEIPKTASSVRDVKLLPPALAALQAQKAHTYLKNSKIFENPATGKPWQGDQAIRKTLWQPALKRAGVRYRKPYQTRHSFASMMLSSGENLAWVSRMLGHSNVMQTAKAYATWIPNTNPDAGEKAVALFSQQ